MKRNIFDVFMTFMLMVNNTALAETRLVPLEYSTIQLAIDDCVNGDIVLVAPGTYTGEGNRDIDFKGKAITVRSQDTDDPSVVELTVIDCEGSLGIPHRGFVFHSGEDSNARIEGLVITNGHSDAGSGILCIDSSPVISKCIIRGNTAVQGHGDPRRDEYRVSPLGAGGGILAMNGTGLIVEECVFTENHALHGGGLYLTEALDFRVTHCVIDGNRADGRGGGVYCGSYQVNAGSLSKCQINSNQASEGGGLCCGGVRLAISHCIISSNWASLELTNIPSMRSGCGGILSEQSPIHVENCTIVGNHANASGGGIGSRSGGLGGLTMKNCIVWGNTALYGHQLSRMCGGCVQGAQNSEISYCCIAAGDNDLFAEDYFSLGGSRTWTIDLAATHGIDDDPCFVNPGHWDDNGTPYSPNDDVWGNGNYHLKSQAGQWDPDEAVWIPGDVTSPALTQVIRTALLAGRRIRMVG